MKRPMLALAMVLATMSWSAVAAHAECSFTGIADESCAMSSRFGACRGETEQLRASPTCGPPPRQLPTSLVH